MVLQPCAGKQATAKPNASQNLRQKNALLEVSDASKLRKRVYAEIPYVGVNYLRAPAQVVFIQGVLKITGITQLRGTLIFTFRDCIGRLCKAA